MPNYDTLTKDQLVDEIKKRRKAGSGITVDLRSDVAVLIAALVADYTAPPEKEQEPEKPQDTSVAKIKQEAAARADGVKEREVPQDLHEYAGNYKYLRTGETGFGLKILPDADVRAHRTHHAKSPLSFWDGTKEEFREQFDKI